MEYITEKNLNKYKSIIEAINKSNAEFEILKRKQSEVKHKLFALELSKVSDNILKSKLISVIVKVFDTIFELHNLYDDVLPDEEFKRLNTYKNCSYCLVQINIIKDFLDRLSFPRWMFHVTVGNDSSKTVRLLSVDASNCTIFTVLPLVPSHSYDDEVSVSLIWANDTSWNDGSTLWPKLHITTIPIDISYYFRSASIKNGSKSNETSLQASCKEESSNRNSIIQYKFTYKHPFENLFKSIMQNCYHKIDPRNLGVFLRNKQEVDVKLETNDAAKINMNLNERLQCLTITTTPYIMLLLKEYFASQFTFESPINFSKAEGKLVKLKSNFIEKIDNEEATNQMNLLTLDYELRSIMYDYPF